jgi:hypothetical protein
MGCPFRSGFRTRQSRAVLGPISRYSAKYNLDIAGGSVLKPLLCRDAQRSAAGDPNAPVALPSGSRLNAIPFNERL